MPLTRLGRVKSAAADAAERDLKALPWAETAAPALQRYVDAQPDAEALARVDNYQATPIEYLENPHLRVRSIENETAHMFRNFLTNIEQHLDTESARKVAYGAGLAHGKRRMGKFLAGQNLPGGPKTMAMLQDTGHASAGPRHATALFARYNDRLVEVVRTEDSYGAHSGAESPVSTAFFDGFIDGYLETDPALLRIEELTRERSDGRVEFVHRFWYGPEA